jgi:hypothetical protein
MHRYYLLMGERAAPDSEHSWLAAVIDWMDPF